MPSLNFLQLLIIDLVVTIRQQNLHLLFHSLGKILLFLRPQTGGIDFASPQSLLNRERY
jgi:hypothetical protein